MGRHKTPERCRGNSRMGMQCQPAAIVLMAAVAMGDVSISRREGQLDPAAVEDGGTRAVAFLTYVHEK